jgi:hypothetical protein
MTKGDKLLLQILNFLASADQTDRPEMREAARMYAEACAQANREIEGCGSLLTKGLLTEAVMYAQEFDPPLLIRIEKLNFKNRDRWVEFCRTYNWQEPPDLDLKTALLLDEAYRSTESLKPLMDQWREVVRTGSTVSKLSLVRRIAVLAPDNDAWQRNLLELERERISELVEDARDAIEGKDHERLKEIHNEIFSTGFTIEPEERVTEKMEAILRQYHSECLRTKADQTRLAINDAYAMFQYESLSGLMERWDALCSDEAFSPTEQDRIQVGDARNWLTKKRAELEVEEKIRTLRSALTNALDQRVPMSEIEKLHFSLKETGTDIEEYLEARVRSARENWEMEQDRLHRNRIITGIAAAIVVLALSFGGGWFYLEKRAHAEAIESVSKALQSNDPALATELIQRHTAARPQAASSTELIRLGKEAETRINERKRKDALFAETVKRADSLLLDEKTALEHVPALEQAMRDASDQADPANPQHVESLSSLASQIEECRIKVQLNRDTLYKTAYDRTVEKLTALNRWKDTPPTESALAECEVALIECASEMEALRVAEKISPDLKEQVLNDIAARCESGRHWLESAKKLADVYAKLERFSTIGEYKSLIEEYEKLAPSDAKRFATVKKMIPAYLSIDAPQLNCSESHDFRNGFPHALDTVLKSGDSVWHDDLRSFRNNFEAKSADQAGNEAWNREIASMQKLLSSYKYHELRFINPSHGFRYWLYTNRQTKASVTHSKIGGVVNATTCRVNLFAIVEEGSSPYRAEITYKKESFENVIAEGKVSIKLVGAEATPAAKRLFETLGNLMIENVPVEKEGNPFLPEAKHYVTLFEILSKMESADSMDEKEAELWKRIESIAKD